METTPAPWSFIRWSPKNLTQILSFVKSCIELESLIHFENKLNTWGSLTSERLCTPGRWQSIFSIRRSTYLKFLKNQSRKSLYKKWLKGLYLWLEQVFGGPRKGSFIFILRYKLQLQYFKQSIRNKKFFKCSGMLCIFGPVIIDFFIPRSSNCKLNLNWKRKNVRRNA